MAVKVNFYENVSDNRCLHKNIIQVSQADILCDIYEPCDILNPVLIVDIDQLDYANVNYCIIEEFNRRYFITSVVPTSAKRLELTCHVDVLSTYEEQIRDCELIAARSTNNVNYYLHDDLRYFNSYVVNQYIDVGTDIGAPSSLILITIGKGDT